MVRPSLGSVSLNKQGKQGWFWFWFLSQIPGGQLQAQVRRVGLAVSDPGHTEPAAFGWCPLEETPPAAGAPSPAVVRHPRSSLARLFQAGARKLGPFRTLCSAWAPTGSPFGPQGADPPAPLPHPLLASWTSSSWQPFHKVRAGHAAHHVSGQEGEQRGKGPPLPESPSPGTSVRPREDGSRPPGRGPQRDTLRHIQGDVLEPHILTGLPAVRSLGLSPAAL